MESPAKHVYNETLNMFNFPCVNIDKTFGLKSPILNMNLNINGVKMKHIFDENFG